MVTAEQLKRLNDSNKKTNELKSITKSKTIEPYSIEWLIQEEQQHCESNNNDFNITEIGLRNERLELLFPMVYPNENEDDTSDSNVKNYTTRNHKIDNDNFNDTSSIDFPTTRLKPHEITNDLEIELLESSMFNKPFERSKQQLEIDSFSLGNISSDFSRSKSSKEGNKLNSITGEESIRSSGHSVYVSNNLSNPSHRILQLSPEKNRQPNVFKDDNSINHVHSNINNEFNNDSNPNSYDEYLRPKPLKRFRSVSSCDLVFPNLNLKRQAR
ncbi:uncharacterized protein KGF55_004685 [Candida pseudojiufengensis]|uniref:uncharacterized protein n=1 Tax=Candida pseudojiufengensis TaxID=497109 RepID=UPI00222505B5|nr:uncharacterized protein KGF55_004685 [Candida pseudojiufengensis]KAI5960393.1 hypothetical protein KGF55_004685 [Candida pseudojiufengensis]